MSKSTNVCHTSLRQLLLFQRYKIVNCLPKKVVHGNEMQFMRLRHSMTLVGVCRFWLIMKKKYFLLKKSDKGSWKSYIPKALLLA